VEEAYEIDQLRKMVGGRIVFLLKRDLGNRLLNSLPLQEVMVGIVVFRATSLALNQDVLDRQMGVEEDMLVAK